VIPQDHFLKLLDRAVDFSFVNELCHDAYTLDFGRPAYEPEMMSKILFVQSLCDISDRRIEEEVNFNHPRQSLGYLAPVEYIEKELAKIHSPVLPMWSASTLPFHLN